MTKDTDDLKIYVAADASRIVRCAWCGYLFSVTKIQTPQTAYCSADCKHATGVEVNRVCMMCCFLSIFLIPSFLLLTAPSSINVFSWAPWLFLLFAVVILPMPLMLFNSVRKGEETRRTRPKLSRFDEESPDFFLLRNASQHVECPNCDGNIDLSRVSEDMIYHCEYCGASGKVEILKIGEQ